MWHKIIMSIGVYKITSPNESFYIGLTLDSFESRWAGHLKELKGNRHKCLGLKRAFDKYGWQNLNKEVIEHWEKPNDVDDLLAVGKLIYLREQYWWDYFSSIKPLAYNGRPTGNGSVFHTDETKLAISKSVNANNVTFRNYLEKLDRDKDVVLALASNPKITRADTVAQLGVSKRALVRYLKENNIPFLFSLKKDLSSFPIEKWYFEEKKTIREIATLAGCSHPLIINEIRRLREDS